MFDKANHSFKVQVPFHTVHTYIANLWKKTTDADYIKANRYRFTVLV